MPYSLQNLNVAVIAALIASMAILVQFHNQAAVISLTLFWTGVPTCVFGFLGATENGKPNRWYVGTFITGLMLVVADFAYLLRLTVSA